MNENNQARAMASQIQYSCHRKLMASSVLIPFLVVAVSLSGCARDSSSPFQAKPFDFSKLAPAQTLKKNTDPALLNSPSPDPQAPSQFKARFNTSKGSFVAEIHRDWSPNGVDRFYNMVSKGYFEDIAIFRAVKGFMFQFGIHGDPAVNKVWCDSNISDDPSVEVSNLPGMLCFAKTGEPNSRSVQMFVNLGNNCSLDRDGFTPFGKVIEGLEVVEAINTEYGENPRTEDIQGKFKRKGNSYIMKRFPRLDLIRSVELVN